MSDQNQTQMDKTPGIFSWNELVTRDADASATFYASLLGWTREDTDMGGFKYSMFKSGERPVAGMIQLSEDEAPVAWFAYVTVQDLDAAVAKATELGASVCKEITALSMGRFAIIVDPQGATLGLWEFAS
jgi:predicted enzyme related to lactoylglutathione lyase